jgi:CYTH domain-containing protein
MYHEIERKFLVKKVPSLIGIRKVPQERYFIQRGLLFEEGVKKKGSVFEYESKFTLSKKEKTREKVMITKEEFDSLKIKGTHVLERDSYRISKKKPIISIKKYKGDYKGLVLAEVEFDSLEEMEEFDPSLGWVERLLIQSLAKMQVL